MKKMRLQFTVCVCVCACACARARVCVCEREKCCRLAHITMSTVTSNETATTDRLQLLSSVQFIYTTGLNPAASDRQLILHDPVTGLLAVIECGPRLTGKILYSMCILQEAVKHTRGATWYSVSLGHVAHTHITDGTLINRIHKI